MWRFACVYWYLCVWRSEDILDAIPRKPSIFCLRQSLFWDWNFTTQAKLVDLQASRDQPPSVSISSSLGLHVMATMPGFYMCVEDLDSGPYHCEASALWIEPSPQPQAIILNKFCITNKGFFVQQVAIHSQIQNLLSLLF